MGEPWISPQGEVIVRPGLVQRLDRTTSGIMIIAKTQEAWDYLRAEFKARRVEKTYRALVYGQPANSGRIVAEIVRTKEIPKRWIACDCNESDVRAAITDWRVLDRRMYHREAVSLVEAYPRTGRTHQIRVHMAHGGHPVVADHLYACDWPTLGFSRPMLHSHAIAFTVPSGERVSFSTPLTGDELRHFAPHNSV